MQTRRPSVTLAKQLRQRLDRTPARLIGTGPLRASRKHARSVHQGCVEMTAPVITLRLVSLALFAMPCDSQAQTRVPGNRGAGDQVLAGPIRSAASDPNGVELEPAAATGSVVQSQPASRNDSLVDGAVFGAIAGGLALGLSGALICKAQQAEGGPSCGPDFLRIGAIGAAIGTGIGIGIDAALTRGLGVTLSIRSRF
jgi:hypothetical protein